uniref:ATP synthase complex subunit 8 n=1 Tax=Claassenia magna TaxID=2898275 RepID=A0A6B9PA17_9NEOP|nr:ATP synthase F0 subunit 8 [Claassenia magna]WHU31440.1 ATP synthase F0 subunit 8 [Claassenia magna]
MPQMAPLSWLILFLVFSATLVLFNSLNYFSYFIQSSQSQKKTEISHHSMNWKW